MVLLMTMTSREQKRDIAIPTSILIAIPSAIPTALGTNSNTDRNSNKIVIYSYAASQVGRPRLYRASTYSILGGTFF